MICPTCAKAEKTSTIRPNPEQGSLKQVGMDSFYDEVGAFHQHYGGALVTSWVCSKGHKLKRLLTPPCPSCTWGGKDDVEVDS